MRFYLLAAALGLAVLALNFVSFEAFCLALAILVMAAGLFSLAASRKAMGPSLLAASKVTFLGLCCVWIVYTVGVRLLSSTEFHTDSVAFIKPTQWTVKQGKTTSYHHGWLITTDRGWRWRTELFAECLNPGGKVILEVRRRNGRTSAVYFRRCAD